MRTDGRTDMTKQIVAFRNFANHPEDLTMLQSIEKCNHTLSVYFKHTLVVVVVVVDAGVGVGVGVVEVDFDDVGVGVGGGGAAIVHLRV